MPVLGSGIILPRPGHVPDPYQIYIDRCVVTMDSDATTDLYDVLIDDDAGSDSDFMIFALPSGSLVMDIGVEVAEAITDAAIFIAGDYISTVGWIGVDAFDGSDTGLGIRWGSERANNFLVDSTTDYGAIATVSTSAATFSAYGLQGGKTGVVDSSSTGSALDQYVIIASNVGGAAAEAGVLVFWIKYSFASLNPPFVADSNMESTGD